MIDFPSNFTPTIITVITPAILEWTKTHGLTVVLIILGALIFRAVLIRIVDRAIKKAIVSDGEKVSKEAEEKREQTLIRIINGTLDVVIWLTAIMMILSEVGVSVGPLIATAGIAGVAVGFGGQYLIRDVISGLFIIIENQYRVGDVACFDSTCGLVEDISLRMTTLRDLDGVVHHVPHGEIKIVSNLSKGFARVNLNVGVAYEADLEHVIKVVNKVGQELSEDPDFKEMIISAPKFLRVDNFGDSSVDIKILGDTEPLKQWEVTGELRKRLKIAFDKEGIVIPYPQRTISYLENDSSKK